MQRVQICFIKLANGKEYKFIGDEQITRDELLSSPLDIEAIVISDPFDMDEHGEVMMTRFEETSDKIN